MLPLKFFGVMSANQINSNEEPGDPCDAQDEGIDEVTSVEESINRRFDPEALALQGPSRGDDDAIYVDDMYGDWFLDYAS